MLFRVSMLKATRINKRVPNSTMQVSWRICFYVGNCLSANIMRPRFVPNEKTMEALFSDDNVIEAGENFTKTFAYNSADVCVTGVPYCAPLRLNLRCVHTHMLLTYDDDFSSFSDAEFCSPIMQNINRLHYRQPTPIQRHAIPLIQRGFCVSFAQTTVVLCPHRWRSNCACANGQR